MTCAERQSRGSRSSEATEAEIAYITGLSLRGVRAILDSHYLS